MTGELKALKRLANVLLGFSEQQIEAARAAGELTEVERNGGDKEKSWKRNSNFGPQDCGRPSQGRARGQGDHA